MKGRFRVYESGCGRQIPIFSFHHFFFFNGISISAQHLPGEHEFSSNRTEWEVSPPSTPQSPANHQIPSQRTLRATIEIFVTESCENTGGTAKLRQQATQTSRVQADRRLVKPWWWCFASACWTRPESKSWSSEGTSGVSLLIAPTSKPYTSIVIAIISLQTPKVHKLKPKISNGVKKPSSTPSAIPHPHQPPSSLPWSKDARGDLTVMTNLTWAVTTYMDYIISRKLYQTIWKCEVHTWDKHEKCVKYICIYIKKNFSSKTEHLRLCNVFHWSPSCCVVWIRRKLWQSCLKCFPLNYV